ncbi:MAG: tRNA preQ1(34) S-adenosylmethionine ribosyltransferase-isomerase QueA [Acidimicrobiia bacterium]|nr:tRNA preQ1(34) S-adenosylmethionine ribosyltransferase-isomerase QueA [Acidimicrobiia bacterium]MDH3396332.1 tRNA preQ1(34) S-adenosylmethionine ribosyltransferase-isomerase QueA [Acidimicrobiia bacterium]
MAVRTVDFSYLLPTAVIAQQPVEPRDAARLLDTRDMTDHTFRDLADLLAPGDLVVVNKTRVRAARLRGTKSESGGAVEVLLLRNNAGAHWEALIRPGRRIRPGVVLDLGELTATVTAALPNAVFELDLATTDGTSVERTIARVGETPLPPYVREPLTDPEQYQTIFAERVGSAAAPTAGLHFTDGVVRSLAKRGIDVAAVELEVGLDTFRPMTVGQISEHVMHSERYSVSVGAVGAIARTRQSGGRVVAVGTTVVRTLESAFDGREVVPGDGSSDLFITPGYRFRVVDTLVTNFHVPGSTLVVMMAAFMGSEWRSAYAHALARGYRFLSFGDAMLTECNS